MKLIRVLFAIGLVFITQISLAQVPLPQSNLEKGPIPDGTPGGQPISAANTREWFEARKAPPAGALLSAERVPPAWLRPYFLGEVSVPILPEPTPLQKPAG